MVYTTSRNRKSITQPSMDKRLTSCGSKVIKTSRIEILAGMKDMTTGNESSSQFDMNHWILRFVALIIDNILLGIVAIVIIFGLGALLWGGMYYGLYLWGGFGYALLLPFILGVLSIFYFALFESSSGATLGKKVMGLQVQMVNGNKVTFDKAFIRNISKIYGLFLLLDWLIGIATPGQDHRQKYTDRMAGTTVVSTKQSFMSSAPPPPPPQ